MLPYRTRRGFGKCRIVWGTVIILTIAICCWQYKEWLDQGDCLPEPIDAVYTWVNGSDPKFITSLNGILGQEPPELHHASKERFDDKNELLFSLRSIEKFAPWINNIYIVTNGQVPSWLNLDYKRVKIVTHQEIFQNISHLPTFSSPAIESHLHRIPGVSNRFIYFNDDTFLGAPITREDFISESRGFMIYLAWSLTHCDPNCSWLYVGDGECDDNCNVANCQMDGGDCEQDREEQPPADVVIRSEDYSGPDVIDQRRIDLAYYYQIFEHYSRIKEVRKHLRVGALNSSKTIEELIAEHNRRVLRRNKLQQQSDLRKKRDLQDEIGKSAAELMMGRVKAVKMAEDAYGLSLQHTNRILNERYGFSLRKVPAHAPIMIDRDIMEKAQRQFAAEFDVTSSHRVRSGDDVQYAFLYYYYLIHERIEVELRQIFNRFDTDGSGTWNNGELKLLLAKLYNTPISEDDMAHFEKIIAACLDDNPKGLSKDEDVNSEFVLGCEPFSKILLAVFGFRRKYKYTIVQDASHKHVSFNMIKSNVSDAEDKFFTIRKNENKFICINDNMDPAKESENEMVREMLNELLLSLFPFPSKFELPREYRNARPYINEINLYYYKETITYVAIIFFVIVIVCFVCCPKMCMACLRSIKRRLFG